MDKKRKNNNGITIISLVITLLILLILASVTVKTVSDQIESINSVKGISEETVIKSNVINNQVDILYDELSPNIDDDNTPPTIKTQLHSSDITTKGFTLNIRILDKESGIAKIVWYYKLSSESTYTNSKTDAFAQINGVKAGLREETDKSKTLTDIPSGTYNAYVEVYDVVGNKTTSNTISIATGTVTALTSSNTTITNTPSYWTNGNVSTTITTSVPEFTLQYQVGSISGTWTNYTGAITSTSNTTIYARLYDGKNAGGYISNNINNIDKEAPTISTALDSTATYIGANTIKDFTLNIGITDSLSGLSKITWYYKLSSASSYINAGTDTYMAMNGSTAGTKTAVTKSKQITVTTNGTYNAYAEIYDVAGNKTTTETVNIVKLEVGDYIDYKPDEASEYLLNRRLGTDTYSVEQDPNAVWKILKINNDGSMELIGATSSPRSTVIFEGALGYNNGVYVLNDICKSLYSKNSKGITARSLNIEDFEKFITPTGKAERCIY